MTNPLRIEKIKSPLIRRIFKKISGIDILENWYDEWLRDHADLRGDGDAFLSYMMKKLDIGVQSINGEVLSTIPKEGAFVIVANHPLGGLEGILLTRILREIRPDLKVLTNELLRIFPEFHDIFIGVDVLNTGKQRENMQGMREVARHLSGGGALMVFPAGTVSRIKLPSFTIHDAPWTQMIARLARKYNAPIMPIFVGERNSLLFYLSGYIHKRLRTMLLPRAMIDKVGANIPLHYGEPISAQDLQRLNNNTIATHYIRLCCDVLSTQTHEEGTETGALIGKIKDNVTPDVMQTHINSLSDCLIHCDSGFSLYCAPHNRLGPVMEQLAIERERTFRTVDEGTGRELDSDRFDPHYQHLFLWDSKAQKIAGGYRLGKTDEIVQAFDLDGLYSHSLFEYDKKFLEKMGKTIEVGRSFITPEYQRQPGALDMLWKGIGRFVAANPEYHTLFGCVSISRQYSRLATTLLSDTFLSHYGAQDSVRRDVKARMPLAPHKTPWTKEQLAGLSGIPILNKLIGRIDTGKSIPVLIRHYLALNGQFISFTINAGFNQSLDGLIMVDLREAPNRYLKRYMGADGLKHFKSQWEHRKNAA